MTFVYDDSWREVVHEYLLYGILFKAIEADIKTLESSELKMSYPDLLRKASIWAEKQHNTWRSKFTRMGGILRSQTLRDDFFYDVLVTYKGEKHTLHYNVEIIKAECQVRLNTWIESLQ